MHPFVRTHDVFSDTSTAVSRFPSLLQDEIFEDTATTCVSTQDELQQALTEGGSGATTALHILLCPETKDVPLELTETTLLSVEGFNVTIGCSALSPASALTSGSLASAPSGVARERDGHRGGRDSRRPIPPRGGRGPSQY